MKNLRIIGFFCLIGLLLLFLGLPKISSVLNRSEKPSELSPAISKFWSAALAGNRDALNEIITEMPDDYYVMYNKCGKPDDLYLNMDKIVNKQDRIFHYNTILSISSAIRRHNRAYYKILEERITGNHAVARVDFGKQPDLLVYHDLFLMNKENGQWKIFMIDGGWYLEQDNKYFVQKDCWDKSVTEPFWRPVPE